MGSNSRPCLDACRETLPTVTFHKLWPFLISITVAWILPSVADGSHSHPSIGKQSWNLSIAFAKMIPDGSLLVGTNLKPMPFSIHSGTLLCFARPIWVYQLGDQPSTASSDSSGVCFLQHSGVYWTAMDFQLHNLLLWVCGLHSHPVLPAASAGLLETFIWNSCCKLLQYVLNLQYLLQIVIGYQITIAKRNWIFNTKCNK